METALSAISFAKRINPAAMQAIKTPVLADSYPLQPRITEGYEPFFTGLLGFCADATIDEALAARIKTYVQRWLATIPSMPSTVFRTNRTCAPTSDGAPRHTGRPS